MTKNVLFILMSIIVLFVGVIVSPAFNSMSRAQTIVPLEYKYITYPASSSRPFILSKLNTEGLGGWDVVGLAECDGASCTTLRTLLKRPK